MRRSWGVTENPTLAPIRYRKHIMKNTR